MHPRLSRRRSGTAPCPSCAVTATPRRARPRSTAAGAPGRAGRPAARTPRAGRTPRPRAAGRRRAPAGPPSARPLRDRAPRHRHRGPTADGRTGWRAAGSAPSRRRRTNGDWPPPRSVHPAADAGRRPGVRAPGAAAPPARPHGAVESSSRNSSPRPARTSCTAQSGGAIGTPFSAGSSPMTGRPEKSDGSCTLAITVVSGSSRVVASWVSAAVLPMPGSPHNRTGRSAATARVSASNCGSGRGAVVVSRSRSSSAADTSSREAGAEGAAEGGGEEAREAYVVMRHHL